MVCKKYYLDVVIMELGSTSTYKKVSSGCMSVINRHLDYMLKSGIDVCEQHERLSSFYWLPKLHKTPYEPGSLLPQIDVYVKARL